MAVTEGPTPEERRKAIEPHVSAIGELVCSWNHLQEELAHLFWRVSKIPDGDIAFTIWHSTPNDHAQRSMLRAAARVSLAANEKVLGAVTWLLDRIDNSLRHKRNDAVHAPLILAVGSGGITVIPRDCTNNPRAASLEGKDIMKELIWYRETADALQHYCWQLNFVLTSPQLPFPEKPICSSVGFATAAIDARGSIAATSVLPSPKS